ncbi:hypothetical protein JCM10049v2_007628 [Rhodotorula toruloides]
MPRGSGTSRSSFCLQSTASSPADFHDTSITDSPSSRRSSYDPPLTSAQAWDVDTGVDEREKTSKCDAGDQRGNEQAKKAEDEEDFGEQAALEAADRLRKRLLDIARSLRS